MKGFNKKNHSGSKRKSNIKKNPSKEKLIAEAFKLHAKGNIIEAAKYYQFLINENYKDYRVFSNYGVILYNQGKLQKAESLYRKAIQIKPDFAEAYSNLGVILKDLR